VIHCSVNEEFFRKRSYTHRYDHLASVKWQIRTVKLQHYIIQYQDIVEEVTPNEVVIER
jgi:hypothetical protein